MAFFISLISFTDVTHVRPDEIEKVKVLIEVLQMRQSLLSETTLVSEDALCPICYAQQNGKISLKNHFKALIFRFLDAIFEPCLHQSCHSCIIQHLMSVKICFYCKALIHSVKKFDGTVLYEVPLISPSVSQVSRDTQTLPDDDVLDDIEEIDVN